MRRLLFAKKIVAFLAVLTVSTSLFATTTSQSVQADESVCVFFVKNTNYAGSKNLTGNTKYVDSVERLYETLQNHVDPNIKKCENQRDVKSSFYDFLKKLPSDKRSSSTTFLIVLNGHGAQDSSSTYGFKNIDGGTSGSPSRSSYVPLHDFLDAYKKCVAPGGAIPKNKKAKFVFWVLTCRSKENGSVPTHSVSHGDFEYDVLYACESGATVDVGDKVPIYAIQEALIEGVSGAADAEDNYDRNGFSGDDDAVVGGNYDGNVSFGEIHYYAKARNAEIMTTFGKAVTKSYAEIAGKKYSNSILASIDRSFYTPRPSDSDFRGDRHEEIFEGRACSVEDYEDVPFPYGLPLDYRYDSRFRNFDFKNGVYWGAYFRGLDMSNAKFASGKLKGAYFDHCNLNGATCGGKFLTDEDTQEAEDFTVDNK